MKIILLPLTPSESELDGSAVLTEIQNQHGLIDLVTITWTIASEEGKTANVERGDLKIAVAGCSKDAPSTLSINHITLHQDDSTITVSRTSRSSQKTLLPDSPLKIAFSPTSKTDLLVACGNGLVYVFDPKEKSWLASFTTRFVNPDETDANPGQARRKRILDAAWAANGTAIVALLADGEWGVWDVDGSHSKKSSSQALSSSFALWGMIGSGVPSHVSKSHDSRKSFEPSSFLPTMTPNTRRSKADTLFSGQVASENSNSSGGLVVTQAPLPSADNYEDNVAFWYNDTVCYLDSLQAYWARAAKRSVDSKLQAPGGSLFGPALTRVDGLDLGGQSMTAITQLPALRVDQSSPRTIAVTTEHRLRCFSRTPQRASTLGTVLVERTNNRSSHSHSQTLFPKQNLDLETMDAILDSMDGQDVSMAGALPSV